MSTPTTSPSAFRSSKRKHTILATNALRRTRHISHMPGIGGDESEYEVPNEEESGDESGDESQEGQGMMSRWPRRMRMRSSTSVVMRRM